MQQDLDQVYSWANDVGMVFNAGKCEVLRFWVDHTKAPDILYMAPDGGPIEEKDCLRDLGVRVSTDLSFASQIDMTVESGSRMACWAPKDLQKEGQASEESHTTKDGSLQPVMVTKGPAVYKSSRISTEKLSFSDKGPRSTGEELLGEAD